MLLITRKMSALTLTAAALALPAGAQAASPVSAKAVVQASVRAELHLAQAQQLAHQSSASAHAKATALLARSRTELRSAAVKANRLSDRANSSVKVHAAVKTNTQLSSTLAEDTNVLADIAINAGGRLASKAAAALVNDLRMQQDIVDATIELATTTGVDAKHALQGVVNEQQDIVAEVNAAAKVASSPHVSAKVTASADLAVGVGIQTIAAAANSAHTIQTNVTDSAASTLQSLQQRLNGAAARITAIIAESNISADEVAVSGIGNITLGLLAQTSINLTTTATVDANASVRAGLLTGLMTGLPGRR